MHTNPWTIGRGHGSRWRAVGFLGLIAVTVLLMGIFGRARTPETLPLESAASLLDVERPAPAPAAPVAAAEPAPAVLDVGPIMRVQAPPLVITVTIPSRKAKAAQKAAEPAAPTPPPAAP